MLRCVQVFNETTSSRKSPNCHCWVVRDITVWGQESWCALRPVTARTTTRTDGYRDPTSQNNDSVDVFLPKYDLHYGCDNSARVQSISSRDSIHKKNEGWRVRVLLTDSVSWIRELSDSRRINCPRVRIPNSSRVVSFRDGDDNWIVNNGCRIKDGSDRKYDEEVFHNFNRQRRHLSREDCHELGRS